MVRRFVATLPLIGLAVTGTAADANDSVGYRLHLSVPLHCTVNHRPAPAAQGPDGAVGLGELREYCNAPQGYQLIVNYTPGSLRGAVVVAGEDRIVLDGSGQAVLTRAPGPRIRNRALFAIPGNNGFDADRLGFSIVTS